MFNLWVIHFEASIKYSTNLSTDTSLSLHYLSLENVDLSGPLALAICGHVCI